MYTHLYTGVHSILKAYTGAVVHEYTEHTHRRWGLERAMQLEGNGSPTVLPWCTSQKSDFSTVALQQHFLEHFSAHGNRTKKGGRVYLPHIEINSYWNKTNTIGISNEYILTCMEFVKFFKIKLTCINHRKRLKENTKKSVKCTVKMFWGEYFYWFLYLIKFASFVLLFRT